MKRERKKRTKLAENPKSIVFGVEMQQKLTNNWYWAKFAPHLTAFRSSVLMWWICARVCRLFYIRLADIYIRFIFNLKYVWTNRYSYLFFGFDRMRRRTKKKKRKYVNIVDFWNASFRSQHITCECSVAWRWDGTGRQNYIVDFSCILLKQTTPKYLYSINGIIGIHLLLLFFSSYYHQTVPKIDLLKMHTLNWWIMNDLPCKGHFNHTTHYTHTQSIESRRFIDGK